MDQKVIISIVFCGIIIATCHGIPLDNPQDDQNLEQEKENSEVCMSPECKYAAASILENMDPTIKPCDDFYAFACGNFTANRKIPEDKALLTMGIEQFDILMSNFQKVLSTDNDSDLKIFREMKYMYKLCTNASLIEQQGNAPLLEILTKLGGWPLLVGDKWNDSSFNWIHAGNKHKSLGLNDDIFFIIDFEKDLKNSINFLIDIKGVSELHVLQKLKYSKRDPLKYVVDIAVFLGADVNRATKELKDVLEFGSKLSNILEEIKKANQTKEIDAETVPQYRMKLHELCAKFPSIPWKELINKILSPVASVYDDDIVNISHPEFIPQLLKLMQSTPKRVQANYAMLKATLDSATYLTPDLWILTQPWIRKGSGEHTQFNMWKKCVFDIWRALPFALRSLYVRNYISEDVKNDIHEMVDNMRDTFQDMLKKVDWLDEGMKEKAVHKALAMSSLVAYHEDLLNDTIVQNYYGNLTITETNYLGAIRNVYGYREKLFLKKSRMGTTEKDKFEKKMATSINAYYINTENKILIPAALMQGRFFNSALPKYMNYGGIGFFIAHEIAHGFDDEGLDFDENGGLVNWWEPSKKEKFMENAKCLVDQYDNYVITGLNKTIDGNVTLPENIADGGGFKAAYLAYSKWLDRNSNEPKLPGLNYTSHQMFWISAANRWCAKYHSYYLPLQLLYMHSPHEFRVKGAFSNSLEFSKDFGCPLGSNMNPKKKCTIW